MKYYIVFFLIMSLFSCSESESNSVKHIDPVSITEISTNKFLPNSYVFSSIPINYNDYWYYLDKSLGAIIKLNKDFTFNDKVELIGDGPKKIKTAYEMSLTGDYIFVIGNHEIIIYSLITNKILNSYKFPFTLSQQVYYYNNQFLTSYVNPINDELTIASFSFNEDKIYDYHDLAIVNFDKTTSIPDKSGWLISSQNNLIFIKDWLGEITLFDKEFKVLKQQRLPYSGEVGFNRNYEDSKFTSYYYEAYSVAKYNDDIAIMRELDFEEKKNFFLKEDIDDKYLRSRIHVLDQDLNLKTSIKVPDFSTTIYFKNDTLLTLNYEDEKIYMYEIK